jgi:hypothetical protein
MANFAKWVVAAEGALPWRPGEFLRSYFRNRAGVNTDVIEASALGPVVLKFMEGRTSWFGSATKLLSDFDALADEKTRKLRGWPKAENSLSGKLRRLALNLRQLGLLVDMGQNNDRRRDRFIHLEWVRIGSGEPSASSAELGLAPKKSDGAERSSDDRDLPSDDPDSTDRPPADPVFGPASVDSDDADDADDLFAISSGAPVTYLSSDRARLEREEGEL